MKTKIFTLAMMGLALTACKKEENVDPSDDHDHDHDHGNELMTTLKLSYVSGQDTLTYYFRDIDGPGGNAPVIDSIYLDAGVNYMAYAEVWDESKNPPENITPEIVDEADDHLMCYSLSGVNATVDRLDTDGNGLPVGLETSWTNVSASEGTISVSLSHQVGVKDGSDCSLGSYDINVDFPAKVRPGQAQ